MSRSLFSFTITVSVFMVPALTPYYFIRWLTTSKHIYALSENSESLVSYHHGKFVSICYERTSPRTFQPQHRALRPSFAGHTSSWRSPVSPLFALSTQNSKMSHFSDNLAPFYRYPILVETARFLRDCCVC